MPLTSSELKNAAFQLFLAPLFFAIGNVVQRTLACMRFDFARFCERTSSERQIICAHCAAILPACSLQLFTDLHHTSCVCRMATAAAKLQTSHCNGLVFS